MSVCFQKVLSQFGNANTEQGESGWICALLTYAHNNHDTEDLDDFPNPFKETLRRLQGIPIWAHQRLELYLSPLSDRFDRGELR